MNVIAEDVADISSFELKTDAVLDIYSYAPVAGKIAF
jgi:hypothetical protein